MDNGVAPSIALTSSSNVPRLLTIFTLKFLTAMSTPSLAFRELSELRIRPEVVEFDFTLDGCDGPAQAQSLLERRQRLLAVAELIVDDGGDGKKLGIPAAQGQCVAHMVECFG